MRLYLARHCHTNYNDLGLCNYDPAVDVHLTALGIRQAKALADKLKAVPIDHVYVSQLKRTVQTAEIINTFHHLQLDVDSRLNDIYSGYEGKPFKEYRAALDAASDQWTVRFNGGESIEDLKQRVASFIEDLRTKGYNSVLVVTSQWDLYAVIILLQNISNEEAWNLDVEQGSYIELEL